MSENFLQEAVDCHWVAIHVYHPKHPKNVWTIPVRLIKQWMRLEEPDYLYDLEAKVTWNRIVQQLPGGLFTADVRITSRAPGFVPIEKTLRLAVRNGTRPNVLWARAAAEIAVKQVIQEGRLTADEKALRYDGEQDWRHWQRYRGQYVVGQKND